MFGLHLEVMLKGQNYIFNRYRRSKCECFYCKKHMNASYNGKNSRFISPMRFAHSGTKLKRMTGEIICFILKIVFLYVSPIIKL